MDGSGRMEWKRSWMDLLAVAGLAAVLGSLALPWKRVRDCPLFEPECDAWQAPTGGWHEAGWVAVVVAGVALGALLLPKPWMRRGLAGAAGVGLVLGLYAYRALAGFLIFGKAQFLAGFWLAVAGAALAMAGSFGGLLLRRTADPVPAAPPLPPDSSP